MNRTKKFILILSAFLLMAFTAAQADVIVVQTAPVGSITVDWSSVGLPVGTSLHGFLGFANNGDSASATVTGAPATTKGTLIRQGTNWFGNFNPGEYGIWTGNPNSFPNGFGPLTVVMGNSYGAIGAYIQQDFFGAFTAKLDAYNGSTLLGSVTLNGNSNGTPGTALFIGALDKTGPNITKAVFSETAGNHTNNFSIATMYLGVPEPSTMVLLGSGFIGLAGFARRRVNR